MRNLDRQLLMIELETTRVKLIYASFTAICTLLTHYYRRTQVCHLKVAIILALEKTALIGG